MKHERETWDVKALVNESEMVAVRRLKPHPKNYKKHPDEQLDHLIASIVEHGFYRNVVVARDYTILAGHGVVEAVLRMGMLGPDMIPVVRMDVDPDDPQAIKIMLADNEISKLAETDDRKLTELGKAAHGLGELIGTGFDPQSLAMLVMVSRPLEEIRDKNEAAEWVGMPDFDSGKQLYRLVVMFASEADRDALLAQTGIRPSDRNRNGTICSGWWPPRDVQDRGGVLFVDDDDTTSTIKPRVRA